MSKAVEEINGVLTSTWPLTDILGKLKEYEDINEAPIEVIGYKQGYDLLYSMPTCNTCANQDSCKYVSWGDPVVYRCPHYKEDDCYAHS